MASPALFYIYPDLPWLAVACYWPIHVTYLIELIDFEIDDGVQINCLSLDLPRFRIQGSVSATPILHGSLAYLFVNHQRPQDVFNKYRIPRPAYRTVVHPSEFDVGNRRHRDALIYGRMHLPECALEAMYILRKSPSSQIVLKRFSDAQSKYNGIVCLHFIPFQTEKWTFWDRKMELPFLYPVPIIRDPCLLLFLLAILQNEKTGRISEISNTNFCSYLDAHCIPDDPTQIQYGIYLQ